MNKENIQAFIRKWFNQFWAFLKPVLSRSWTATRRAWKKYHATKVLILSVLVVSLVFSVYLAILARSANVNTLRAGLEQSTTIMDENGEEAGTLYAQKGTFVEIDEISPNIVNAVISTEDQRFYEHRGFDPIGIARAAVGYVVNRGQIVGGGSTITQQLAKNAYLTADQTLIRKFRELFLAIEIEKHYNKDQILEMYLNNSYFGNGVWGVEDASLKYFGKTADEVTVPEAATLSAILKAPSHYNPLDNYERSINRRNVVLSLMSETGAITEDEKLNYQQTGLTLVDNYNSTDGYRYPYYFDAVINEAKEKYGIDDDDLLNNGYTVYTSLNQTYQQQMTAAYASNTHLLEKASDGTTAQSASVALNPRTGGVNAVVGGVGDYTFRGLNRATDIKRQPGSVMKPLSVYAPALEAGYNPDDLIKDELLSYGETEYTPTNLSGQYQGEVPMYEALANSYNAPTVWLLNEIGIRNGIRKVQEFGLPISEEDENLAAIALGGMDTGVSPLDLASAYSVFPNEGVRYEPHFITKIVDATGAIIVDNTRVKSKRVLSSEIAEEMNSMLLSVFESGTARNNQPANFKVAGKTGTTQAANGSGVLDQWIVGYTPDIVITSWMGFDRRLEDDHHLTNYSSQGVGQLLKAEMEMILPHTEQTTFLVEEAGQEYVQNNESNLLDQMTEGVEEAGKIIKEGATILRDKATEWFGQFRNRMNE